MNVTSVTKETSFADFVCHVLNICGKKEIVVSVAAANPKIVKKSMFNYLYFLLVQATELSLCSSEFYLPNTF
ncbi:hypothetical protein [Nostoc sp. WHI]|uniref:hypothetical protein n=1 Tax=Nostoc sp. WHI TaxID=2650611 RepID=UPI001E62E090|nr:hypothetical protein [Nostoc sp. WHI]